MLESNWVDVLVEDEGQRDDEVEHVETLGTETVRENLDSVHDNEWREGKTGNRGLVVVVARVGETLTRMRRRRGR